MSVNRRFVASWPPRDYRWSWSSVPESQSSPTAPAARAATAGPCDIYASGGTPCVAAHSTTRALYGAYNGPLYQVRRSSDNTTKDIGVLSAGGVRRRRRAGLVLRQHELRHHRHLRPVRPEQPPHPGARWRRARPRPRRVGQPRRREGGADHASAARRRTASTSRPAPATATTTPTASRPATSRRACTPSSTVRTTTTGAASTTATRRRTPWPTTSASWRPSTSATTRCGATGTATAPGSWRTWSGDCSPG